MKWLFNLKQFNTLLLELRLLGYNLSKEELAVHFIRTRGKILLTMTNYSLPAIPISIFKFRKLKSLNFSNNQINHLSEEISKLTYLNSLNLTNNLIPLLPSSFVKLSFLEELDIANNELSNLDLDFTKLSFLEYLNASNNKIKGVSSSLWNLRLLATLDLSKNELEYIPEFDGMENLHELYLNDNKLRSIPESLAKLKRLRTLHLENNNLTKIPDSMLAKIPDYFFFNASGNDTQAIIQNMGATVIRQVKKSLAEDFKVVKRDPTIDPRVFKLINDELFTKIYLELRLMNIESPIRRIAGRITVESDGLSLILDKLDLEFFPSTLTEIPNIKKLRMPLWLLSSLPRNMNQLINLKELYCWNSKDNELFVLSEVPSSICRFINLEKIDLFFNKIESLPDNIGNLTYLKTLILSFNDIYKLPPSIQDLPNLKVLELKGTGNLNFIPTNLDGVKIIRD